MSKLALYGFLMTAFVGALCVDSALAEPASADAPAATADLEDGAATYAKFCVACHQADGNGLNGMLAAKFSDPTRLAKTDEALLTSIRDGVRGKVGAMPPWNASLSEEQMVNVLGYIRATYTPPASE